MATTVFGVGVGLVILISVWLVSVCVYLVSLRTNRNAGSIALVAACILTVSLFLVPLESKTPTPVAYKVSTNEAEFETYENDHVNPELPDDLPSDISM